jgi:hypothetical protein
MSSFTKALVVSPLENGRNWRLVEPFVYEIGSLGSGDEISVPAGFETDFTSVPRPLWWLIPPWGRYGKAAILHDWLYVSKPCDREKADRVFLEAMTVLAVPRWKRTAMYWAVRLFGWRNYYRGGLNGA